MYISFLNIFRYGNICIPAAPLTLCGHTETEDAHGGILGHGLLHLAAEHPEISDT